MPKFLIADDHPLFREALAGAMQPLIDDLQIIESDSFDTTIAALEQHADIDLILLDLHMPGCENFYGLIRVTEDYPSIPVAVISASDSIDIVSQVMSFGAQGFIPKSTPSAVMAKAIESVLAGTPWLPQKMQSQLAEISDERVCLAHRLASLTPKQFEVLKQMQSGKLNKQIAFDMNVTEATVKAHISAIFRKLEVSTRTQAVLQVESLALE